LIKTALKALENSNTENFSWSIYTSMLYYLLIIWMIQLNICFLKGFSNIEANIRGFATSTQVTPVGEALFFLVSADSENSIVNEKT
jgi:hypothetical protein